MNSQDNIARPDGSLDEIDIGSVESVDDFIRQLEEKERDLHITSDLSIEIEESEFDMAVVPDGVIMPPSQRPEQPVHSAPIDRPLGGAELSDVPSVNRYDSLPVNPPKRNDVNDLRQTKTTFLENEIASLKLRVAELKKERAEIQDKSDRRLKDFENFKYRIDRERRGSFIDQIGNLATQMLPVLDNLNRAIDSVPDEAEVNDPSFKHFFDGIVLVNQQVNEIFVGMGVEPIKSIGEQFDPNFHEAVAVDENPDLPPNIVTGEMLCGYRIGNRVIRHSMVKVTMSSQPQPPAPSNELSLEDVDFDIFNTEPVSETE